MRKTPVFTDLYGKRVTAVKAYGIDEFDFTPNLLDFDFSVGEFGYAVFEFGEKCLYISADGIALTRPQRADVTELIVHKSVQNGFVGAVLQSIHFDGKCYTIQFDGLPPMTGWYKPTDGFSDRSYFELEFPWF